jgi:hypothetical protein
MDSDEWPGTPVPNTRQWAARCLAEMRCQDPLLAMDDAKLLAEDMSTGMHWRAMEPEAAAKLLFEEPGFAKTSDRNPG